MAERGGGRTRLLHLLVVHQTIRPIQLFKTMKQHLVFGVGECGRGDGLARKPTCLPIAAENASN